MAKQIFKVQLDGASLTASQVAGLQKAINAAATSYLAKNIKITPQDGIWGIKKPEWIGIWAKKFKDIASLKAGGFKAI
ncbi:MAG: hypothetical protein QM802_15745 [Agriterribacter sp.]